MLPIFHSNTLSSKIVQRKVHYHRSSNNHHFPFSYSLRWRRRWRPRFHSPGHHRYAKAITTTSFQSLKRERESWEVTADESLLAPTGFLPPMVWGFGVLTFRCKWEWDWDCVLVRESVKWETLNSRCHVRCHAGTEKWSTRAHQARVPQKVVYCYIFPKQCFGAKYFNN